MKVKKSEIQLLIAVIGVLIAVCTYFLVYSSFNEKSDALEAQNVTLSSQVATLEILKQPGRCSPISRILRTASRQISYRKTAL